MSDASAGPDVTPPLDVELSGIPGPDEAGDHPLEDDPRRLWRITGYPSPLQLTDVPTRRRIGFSGKKKRGRKLLESRGEVLAQMQELLWAHVAAAEDRDRRAVDVALSARAPRPSHQENTRRQELFGPAVESALEDLERGPRVLLILQGMDASGKGGMVKTVVGHMDPLGVDVAAFGRPTAAEQREHYLERIIRRLPTPGHVGVFDRSHYEDVLVPTITGAHSLHQLAERTEALHLFERELVRRGFVILKVMLHISAEEQLDRLVSRLDREHKHWKYHPSDADARSEFSTYQKVYAGLIEATDADYAPWFTIGADRKWYSRLAVQELLIAALADLNLKWPAASYDVETERQRLLAT
ncbi:polyphosphate--nucleotide phosphotransferase [Nesterenkonia alba]|uniref:polyphosphate--nucleotide phosphotransferase n=1 Tax=Nesterenkonia alba TaxID=515814 RepID=UPI0003B4AEFA|nr:polyphosphate--nucleotide phosphotransferase [Nesterenkonia alba]